MAIPFVAGLVVGSSIALLFSKQKTLKKVLNTKGIKAALKEGKVFSKKIYGYISQDSSSKSPVEECSKDISKRRKRPSNVKKISKSEEKL